MIAHAEEEFPNESCGIVVDKKYIPYDNASNDKEEAFVISNIEYDRYYANDRIQYIVHSHNNRDSASELDQVKAEDIGLPHIILNIRHGKFAELFCLGIDTPFLGRPFHFGCWDCLQLVYDYYKGKFDIELPNPPRDISFLDNNHNFFEEYLNELTMLVVVGIDDLREDDILFYTHAGRIMHVGIYMDDDKCLHHWLNQPSGFYDIDYKHNNLKFAMRLDND